jgi:hypothetical protein
MSLLWIPLWAYTARGCLLRQRVEIVQGKLEGISETKVILKLPQGKEWVEKEFPRGELAVGLEWVFSHMGQWVRVKLVDGVAKEVSE